MDRIVEPELLDHLRADDPRAIRSRNDLQRVNWFMGSAGILSQQLQKLYSDEIPRRIVELGCGDGSLLLKIAARHPRWRSLEVVLVDRQPVVTDETLRAFAALNWKVRIVGEDVFDWLKRMEASDCILANLFLHHFSEAQLSTLFRLAAKQTRCLVACEPRRTKFFGVARRLLWLIGCNDVTQHDGAISVRAGFRGPELSALWPDPEWKCDEREAGFFSHLFVARRAAIAS